MVTCGPGRRIDNRIDNRCDDQIDDPIVNRKRSQGTVPLYEHGLGSPFLHIPAAPGSRLIIPDAYHGTHITVPVVLGTHEPAGAHLPGFRQA